MHTRDPYRLKCDRGFPRGLGTSAPLPTRLKLYRSLRVPKGYLESRGVQRCTPGSHQIRPPLEQVAPHVGPLS